jgi:hypothetical protein
MKCFVSCVDVLFISNGTIAALSKHEEVESKFLGAITLVENPTAFVGLNKKEVL